MASLAPAARVRICREPSARRVALGLAALLLPIALLLLGWALRLGPSEKQNIIWMFTGLCGFFGLAAALVYALSGVTIIDAGRRVVHLGRKRTLSFDDLRSVVLIDSAALLRPTFRYQLRIVIRGEDQSGLEQVRLFREAVAEAENVEDPEQLEARLALFMPLFEQPSIMLTRGKDKEQLEALAEELAAIVSIPVTRFAYETTEEAVGAIDLLSYRRLLALDRAAETKPAGHSHEGVGVTLGGITFLLLLATIPFVVCHKVREEQRMNEALATALSELSKQEDKEIRNNMLLHARHAAHLALIAGKLSREDASTASPAEARLFQSFVKQQLLTPRYAKVLLANPERQKVLHLVAYGHRAAKAQRRISDTKFLVVRSDEVRFTMIREGRYWLIDDIDISRVMSKTQGSHR